MRQGSAAFPSADPRSARFSIRYIKYRVSPQEVLDLGAPCKAPKWCSHPESGLAPARCRFRPRQHHELADEDRFARTSHPLNRPEDTVGRTGRESRSRTAPHPASPPDQGAVRTRWKQRKTPRWAAALSGALAREGPGFCRERDRLMGRGSRHAGFAARAHRPLSAREDRSCRDR